MHSTPVRPRGGAVWAATKRSLALAGDGHTIGDRVWEDTNRDGLQDAGEPGIADVVIRVLGDGCRATWPSPAITGSSASGGYQVALGGGPRCSLSFTPPTTPTHCYVPTISGVTFGTYDRHYPLDAKDSDVIPWLTGYVTPDFAVPLPDTSEESGFDTAIDAGFVKWVNGGLSGVAWNDRNRNGRRDAGEGGLSGVTVDLMDSLVHVAASATTDTQGGFSFGDLRSDWAYLLRVLPPDGWAFSATDVGDDLVDNDFDDADLFTPDRQGRGTLIFRLESAEWRSSFGAGLYDPLAAPVPEPAAWALWAGALAALGALRRRAAQAPATCAGRRTSRRSGAR